MNDQHTKQRKYFINSCIKPSYLHQAVDVLAIITLGFVLVAMYTGII